MKREKFQKYFLMAFFCGFLFTKVPFSDKYKEADVDLAPDVGPDADGREENSF